jgi:hypothetical protein
MRSTAKRFGNCITRVVHASPQQRWETPNHQLAPGHLTSDAQNGRRIRCLSPLGCLEARLAAGSAARCCPSQCGDVPLTMSSSCCHGTKLCTCPPMTVSLPPLASIPLCRRDPASGTRLPQPSRCRAFFRCRSCHGPWTGQTLLMQGRSSIYTLTPLSFSILEFPFDISHPHPSRAF